MMLSRLVSRAAGGALGQPAPAAAFEAPGRGTVGIDGLRAARAEAPRCRLEAEARGVHGDVGRDS